MSSTMPTDPKFAEPSYAVIVDPDGWSRTVFDLADELWKHLSDLGVSSLLPTPTELASRLGRGPATVIAGVSRSVAQRIVEVLQDSHIGAKLARQATSGPGSAPAIQTTQTQWPKLDLDRRQAEMDRSTEDSHPEAAVPEALPRATGPVPRQASSLPDTSGTTAPGESRRTILGWGDVVPLPQTTPVQEIAVPSLEAAIVPAIGRSPQVELPTASPAPQETTPDAIPALEPPPPGRPVPTDELLPRPWISSLLSALAPGAGQVYLGQRDSARTYAMTAWLLVPWILSVLSARHRARQIHRGAIGARGRPDLRAAVGFIVVFWILVVLITAGCLVVFHQFTEPVALEHPPRTATDAGSAHPDDPGELSPADEPGTVQVDVPSGLADDLERRERRVRAQRLVLNARAACDMEDYRLCYLLSAEARQLDGSLAEAIRLYHRAALALQAGDREDLDSSPTDGEDAQP